MHQLLRLILYLCSGAMSVSPSVHHMLVMLQTTDRSSMPFHYQLAQEF